MTLQLSEVEAFCATLETFDERRASTLALVELQEILFDVTSVVGRGVPPEVDGSFGTGDLLRGTRSVGLAGIGGEGHGVAGTA